MALPKISVPEYTTTLPSTEEEIRYRPFLVKEEKVLLIALESEDEKLINDAIVKIVNECTNGAVGYSHTPIFDLEYMFLNIWAKSVGDVLDLTVICPDDGETEVGIKVKIEDITVMNKEGHTNVVDLTDDIKIVMSYPTSATSRQIAAAGQEEKSSTEITFDLIKSSIEEIHEGETVHRRVDISKKEMDEFFESLQTDMLEKLNEFFDTMPKLQHVVKVKNPKTKKMNEVNLEGLSDFFV